MAKSKAVPHPENEEGKSIQVIHKVFPKRALVGMISINEFLTLA